MTCDGLASRPGGVEILLATSCYGNRDKLRQHEPVLAFKASLFIKITKTMLKSPKNGNMKVTLTNKDMKQILDSMAVNIYSTWQYQVVYLIKSLSLPVCTNYLNRYNRGEVLPSIPVSSSRNLYKRKLKVFAWRRLMLLKLLL